MTLCGYLLSESYLHYFPFFCYERVKSESSIIATFLMAISFLFGYISWDKRLAMRVLKDKEIL